MSIQELEQCVYQIVRVSNILNIARCIFVYDNINDIPKTKLIGKAKFRQSIRLEQFRISLLSQGFKLENIVLDDKKIEIDLQDLLTEGNQSDRIDHCIWLLLHTWKTWNQEQVYINYIDCSDRKICVVSVQGEVCKAIYEGKEECNYLGENSKIEYF